LYVRQQALILEKLDALTKTVGALTARLEATANGSI